MANRTKKNKTKTLDERIAREHANARARLAGDKTITYCKWKGKHRVLFTYLGKKVYLGLFDTEEEAHQEFLEAQRRILEVD